MAALHPMAMPRNKQPERFAARRVASLLVSAAAALACPALAQPANPEPRVPGKVKAVFQLPAGGPVEVRGMVSFDQAGLGTGSMLYPVGNAGLAGLLVGVLTHGALTEASKKAQRQQLQEQADRVLEPYSGAIAATTHSTLAKGVLPLLAASGVELEMVQDSATPPTGRWLFQWQPVYTMTQDQSSLLLDNMVALYSPESPQEPVYQSIIRVVGHPRAETEPRLAWLDNDASAWHKASADLLARAMRLAVQQWQGRYASAADLPQRTVRYRLGREERIERAQILDEQCTTTLLRNLRGGLMEVPTGEAAQDRLGCPRPSAPQAPELTPGRPDATRGAYNGMR